jgi:hypothetical protein
MSKVGFEPAIPASQHPQTYALERVVTGIGFFMFISYFNIGILSRHIDKY